MYLQCWFIGIKGIDHYSVAAVSPSVKADS